MNKVLYANITIITTLGLFYIYSISDKIYINPSLVIGFVILALYVKRFFVNRMFNISKKMIRIVFVLIAFIYLSLAVLYMVIIMELMIDKLLDLLFHFTVNMYYAVVAIYFHALFKKD